MKKQFLGLILVCCLVLLVLLSFIFYNQFPIWTGKQIILKTNPVDPFDPFKGQYMQINYEISTIQNSNFSIGDSVYILLNKDESGIWRYSNYSKTKPESGDFILGKVGYVYGNTARIEYGVEQYYFERNAQFATSNLTIELKVASSGRASIIQLLQDGKPIEIKYQN